MVEVSDEIWVEDVGSRNPEPLLRTVALPVDQVLESPWRSLDPNWWDEKEAGGGTAGDRGLLWSGFTLDTWKVG